MKNSSNSNNLMPSSNNLIQSLRSAHDPHFKLEGRVGGLEKGLGIQVAQ